LEAGMSDKVLYYPVWISNSAAHGRSSLCWGKPCDRPSEARDIGTAEVDAGRATLSFVVQFKGGEKLPLPSYTWPRSARRIIQHWEELMEVTDVPHP
jgi:hypothetical protein